MGVLYKYNGSSWTEVQKTDTTFFTSVDMVNASTGYAVGYTFNPAVAGRGYKTSDGGNTWSAMNLGTSKLMADVSFLDNSVGYVAGEDGRVMKTTNGGSTWTTQNLGTSVSMNTVSVVRRLGSTPSSVSGATFVGGSNAAILHSTFTAPNLMGSYDLGGVFFIDSDTGQRRRIDSPVTFDNWGFKWGDVHWASLSEINLYPQGDNLSSLALNAGRVYLVQSTGFRPIYSADTFNIFKDNWGVGWGDIKPVGDIDFALHGSGSGVMIMPPMLVTYSYGGSVFYMDADGKLPILNPDTFVNWNFQWGNIFYTRNNAFLASFPSPHPLSRLALNGGWVYLISNGVRQHIADSKVFNAHAAYDPAYDWSNIFPVNSDTLSNRTTPGPDITYAEPCQIICFFFPNLREGRRSEY